jgi:hypothetical protein
MDHLSSCYFCGTATDTPLRDYRVVPVELREVDAVATVTLCSSCHVKLERLLGPVVEAAGESGVTLDAHDGSVPASGGNRGTADAADSHAESSDHERNGGADSEEGPLTDEPAPDGTAGDDELIEGTEDEAEEDETEDTETGDEPATRTTVSALEYNKVMRLLQNREFPVDRAEIQTVAANAYGLAQHECAEVIDLAIDRGLIDERDGQLVRPE